MAAKTPGVEARAMRFPAAGEVVWLSHHIVTIYCFNAHVIATALVLHCLFNDFITSVIFIIFIGRVDR